MMGFSGVGLFTEAVKDFEQRFKMRWNTEASTALPSAQRDLLSTWNVYCW